MYKSFSSRNVQTQLQQCAASQQKANASTSTADNKSKKKRGQPLLNCASGRLLHEQSQQRQKEAQQKQQKQSVSKQRDAFESFFGAILECAASLYLEAAQVEAASDSTKPLLLWKLLCHLLGVPHIPLHNKPLPTKYSSATKYFSHRAALVVEEARYVIGEGLLQYWNNNGNKHKTSALPNKNNHANAVKVKLLEVKEVTQKQLMNMTFQLDNTRVYSKAQWDPFRRPGTIVQCIPIRSGSSTRMEDTILGCVGNRSSGGEDGELHQFHMMTSSSYYLIANKNKNNNADEWLVVPLTTLLSQCRQWESLQCSRHQVAAGSNAVYQLPFEALLLGRHGNKDNNTSKEQQSSCVNTIVGGRTEDEDHTIADGDGDLIDLTVDIATTGDWNLPALNERQEEVVRSFLKSPKGSITLTQGVCSLFRCSILLYLSFYFILRFFSFNYSPNNMLHPVPLYSPLEQARRCYW